VAGSLLETGSRKSSRTSLPGHLLGFSERSQGPDLCCIALSGSPYSRAGASAHPSAYESTVSLSGGCSGSRARPRPILGFGSEGAAELLSGPDHAADTAQSILLMVVVTGGYVLRHHKCWSLGTRTPDLFHAIDSRPVWWTGLEAGNWSPASAVDRDYASGSVSSLAIRVVVSRSTPWRHNGVQPGFAYLAGRPRLNRHRRPPWPEASTGT
jgi:hypothetical protein